MIQSMKIEILGVLPEKKCAISSFEQPNGRPRRRTTASLLFSWPGPLRFTTHSISLRLERNTEMVYMYTLYTGCLLMLFGL